MATLKTGICSKTAICHSKEQYNEESYGLLVDEENSHFPRNEKMNIFNKGFTFLELIVVIFVISLILAVSLPSFMLQEEGELKSEAGRIASIIRYLNDSAVSTKETYSINVKFKEKSIRYKIPEGEREEKIHYLSHVFLQSKGNVSEGEVTIFFYPTGAGENFTVYLTGLESTMEIIFNALSGRVKVSAHEGT